MPVRDDLRALEGYHSAQVDVEVRLNTNESPYPPPAAWADELAAALATIDWHRYPDRAATGLRAAIADWHGVDAGQVFAANGSNEVLQTLLLTYAGPGRTVRHVRADVPAARPHRPHHRRDGRRGRARDPTSRSTSTRPRAMVADARPGGHVPVLAEQPDRARRGPRRRSRRLLAVAPGLVVVDEAYAQFADWSALDLVDDDVPLVVVRTFSKTWSMAAARLGYLVGPSWLVAELEKVVLPYHLDAAKQVAGRLALRHVDEMDARVKHDRRRARAAQSTALGDAAASTSFPSGANFVLFRPAATCAGHEVWQGLVDRGVLVRDCSRLAAPRRLPAGHDRHAGGERPLPRRAARRAR